MTSAITRFTVLIDAIVPIYDGIAVDDPFHFKALSDFDDQLLSTNMAVLVTFTVSKYSMSRFSKGRSDVTGCSLNVQELVVLADSETNNNFLGQFSPDPTCLDMGHYPPLSKFQSGNTTASKKDIDKLDKIEEETRATRTKAFSSPFGSLSKR
jgi:hypothetical protein